MNICIDCGKPIHGNGGGNAPRCVPCETKNLFRGLRITPHGVEPIESEAQEARRAAWRAYQRGYRARKALAVLRGGATAGDQSNTVP